MSEKPFEVGNMVTITHHGEVCRLSHVKRVVGRFVELADGSKWHPIGQRPYPRPTDRWHGRSIRHTTEEDRSALRRVKYAGRLHNVVWSTFSVDDLRKVNLLLDRLEKRRADR